MINKMTIKDVDLKGKKILVRADFNVPMQKDGSGVITDDTRIIAVLPTIKYLLEQGVKKIVLMSHLGDPKKEEKKAKEKEGTAFDKTSFDEKIKKTLSLLPVAKHLESLIGEKVKMAELSFESAVEKFLAEEDSHFLLLENTRFYDGETSKDENERLKLAEKFVKGLDLFVNDAFGTAHRAHASTTTVATVLPAVTGFLVEKELNFLEDKVLKNPVHPFIAIVGGAKVSSKIGVIENLLVKTDAIVIGGGMAYTFFKAQGYSVGTSLVEDDQIETAKKIMETAKAKNVDLILPVDVVVADDFSEDAQTQIVDIDAIPDGWMGLDAGPKSIEKILGILKNAKTVFWNGPLGVFEFPKFAKGTSAIAKMLATLEGVLTIIGGGDSVAAINAEGLGDKMTHMSTGGGAAMELIEGKVLPGIAALQDK